MDLNLERGYVIDYTIHINFYTKIIDFQKVKIRNFS